MSEQKRNMTQDSPKNTRAALDPNENLQGTYFGSTLDSGLVSELMQIYDNVTNTKNLPQNHDPHQQQRNYTQEARPWHESDQNLSHDNHQMCLLHDFTPPRHPNTNLLQEQSEHREHPLHQHGNHPGNEWNYPPSLNYPSPWNTLANGIHHNMGEPYHIPNQARGNNRHFLDPFTRRSSNSPGKRQSSQSSDGSTAFSRKKGKFDKRWSTRFTWPDELHRDFVSAVFDVGLKHSSISQIEEEMPRREEVTLESIQEYLRVYRLNRDASVEELRGECCQAMDDNGETKPKMELDGVKIWSSINMSCYEIALNHTNKTVSSNSAPHSIHSKCEDGNAEIRRNPLISLPRLSKEEEQSPIGSSFGYLLGLFLSLKQQLVLERAAKEEEKAS